MNNSNKQKEELLNSDEKLFDSIQKKKKDKKRRLIITIIAAAVILALAVTFGVITARRKVMIKMANSEDVSSAKAERGGISTTVSGSGTLSNVEEEELKIPYGVEIDEIEVDINERVKKGDVIASVDKASVLSTMVSIQDEIAEIDKKIDDARGDSVEPYISSGAEGTVTKIYGKKGDSVAALMAEHGCLAEITLKNEQIIRVTGLAGTISSVNISEGSKVFKGTVIFNLTDTKFSVNYDSYVKEREEKEELLLKLVKIRNDGAFTAPYDGSVSSIEYDEDTDYSELDEFTVVTMSPDKEVEVSISVDESNILSIAPGQEADVTISSVGEDTFKGVVTEVDKEAESSSGVTRYTAVITLDKTEKMLPGMTAKVVINISGKENAIIIPVDALHQTSSKSYVYTQYDKETGEFGGIKEVVAGISNSNYVEIISGLNEGDTVYYIESKDDPFAMMRYGNRNAEEGGAGASPERPSGGEMRPGGGMPGGDFPGGNRR